LQSVPRMPRHALVSGRPGRGRRTAAVIAALVLFAGQQPIRAAPDDADIDDPITAAIANSRRFSLEEVLALAERQGPTVVRAEIDYDIAAALARSLRRPWQAALGIGGNRVDEGGTSLAPPRTAGRPFVEATVGHRFSTGTSIESRLRGHSDSDSDSAWSSAQLAVTQQLVRGLRPSVVDADRIAAEHAARASLFSSRATLADVRATAAATYWELAFAHADLEIRRLSLAAARDQTRLTDLLVRGGTVPRSAMLAAEQAVSARLEGVVFAYQSVVERSLELRSILGLALDRELVIVPADRPPMNALRVERGSALEKALASSPALAAAAANLAAASAQRRATDDRVLPGLDLAIVADTTQDHVADKAARDPMRPIGGESITATLTLRYDLFGGQRGERDRGRAAERQARLDRDVIRLRVERDVLTAVTRLDLSARRMSLTRGSEDRAEAILRAETTRFSGGQATVFDVLARQEELEEARRAALRASIDHAIATADLQRLVGRAGAVPADR
jgi:outer membrane protein TolC